MTSVPSEHENGSHPARSSLSSELPNRWAGSLACLILIATTLIFFRTAIFNPYGYFPWDTVDQHGGIRQFLVRCIRAGEFPLWCPYLLSGYPMIGDPPAELFYPGTWLEAVSPWGGNLKWMCWETTLHYFIASVFMYLLLRSLSLTACPALSGALLFGFCGYMPVYSSQQVNINSLAWFPAICWTSLGFWQTGRRRYFSAAVFAAACMWFGGHVQIAFYSLFFLFLFFLGLMFSGPMSGWREWLRCLSVPVSVAIVGTMLASILLLPARDAVSRSARAEFDAKQAHISLVPANLINMFLPNLYNPARTGDKTEAYLGKELLAEQLYCGWFVLLMPFAFLRMNRRSAFMAVSLLLLGLLALLLASGNATPLYAMFHEYVPFASKFRRPFTFWAFASFFLAALSALAVQRLLQYCKDGFPWLRVLLPLILICLVYAVLSIWPSMFSWIVSGTAPNAASASKEAHASALGASAQSMLILGMIVLVIFSSVRARPSLSRFLGPLLVLVAILDILLNCSGKKYNAMTVDNHIFPASTIVSVDKVYNSELPVADQIGMPLRGNTPRWRGLVLQGGAWLNGGAALGMEEPCGYVNIISERYADYVAAIDRMESPLINLLSIRYILWPPEAPLASQPETTFDERRYQTGRGVCSIRVADTGPPPSVTPLDPEGNWWFKPMENRLALPRFWIANSYQLVASKAESLALLRSSIFDPRSVILESAPKTPLSGTGTVELVEYGLNFLRLKTFSTGPALLFMSESFDPCWLATVDGKPAEILIANHSFRALEISTGQNDVMLTYRSKPFHAGAAITCVTLALLTLWAVFPRRKRVAANLPPKVETEAETANA